MNVILVGFKSCGKTTAGKELAKELNLEFIEVDELLEELYYEKYNERLSFKEIYKKHGEEFFRKLESEALIRLKDKKNIVLSLGGGTVLSEQNRKVMKEIGTIVYLDVDKSILLDRILNADELPAFLDKDRSEKSFEEIFDKRKPIYSEIADYRIKIKDEPISEILKKISEKLPIKKISIKNIKTKICIPITADIVEEGLGNLKKAGEKNELVELRIDFIKDIDEEKVEKLLRNKSGEVIVTCRPKSEGGNFEGGEEDRILFLRKAIESGAEYVDVEFKTNKKLINEVINNESNKTKEIEDFRGTQKSKISGVLETGGFHEFEKQKFFKQSKIIISYHNFDETLPIDELENIYNEIKKLNPDLVKIVTFANSLNDNFNMFRLLEGKKDLIGFCMGIKGHISRVLAPKFNSLITFASLEKSKESADGQLTIEEMKNEYNFDLINEDTRLLGVIGEFAENSKSRHMHNKMFKEKGVNFIYHPLKLEKNDLEAFMNNFNKFDFAGAAVTVPYKEEIMKYLDDTDETAKNIGAVNTIVNDDGRLIGYNTDYFGAVEALKEKTQLNGKKVLVIGAGGAARAVVYGLRKENAEITIMNRTAEKAQKLAEEFNIKADELENIKKLIMDNEIVINTTSVGMSPNSGRSIIPEDCLINDKIIMDIVYTPIRTKLIESAEKANCSTITGERMLVHQAMKQYELWTKEKADFKIMEKAIIEKIKNQ